MTIAEQIYSLVQTLSQEQASEILTFAEYICFKNQSAKADDPAADSVVLWGALVHSLAGAWADDFPTLEEIRGGLGQDAVRESF